ncbi:MAG: DUF559 domain-containing protein [Actinoplanes sp.]
MPTPTHRPPTLTGRVFRGAETIGHGLLTVDALRSQAWVRLRHDVYADARLPRDHGLACAAARLRLPPPTVFAGRSAAFLLGITEAATFDDEVHVITSTGVRLSRQHRLAIHHTNLTVDEVIDVGLPVTTATRTAWDVAKWHEPLDAVPIIDALLRRHLTTIPELTAQIARHHGRRGWRKAQQAYALTDPGAQSPAESRLRVRLVLAGLPTPVAQHPIPVPDGRLLHPDLAWPAHRVAVEYDGATHATINQLHRDRKRMNQLATAGWTVLHVTSRRAATDFPALVTEIQTALTQNAPHP